MKKILSLALGTLMALVTVVLYKPQIAFAKPVSNTLRTSIKVEKKFIDVGDSQDVINNIISNSPSRSKIMIKSGEYRLDEIVDKDVMLCSADGGYVDIIVNSDLPEKIEVDSKVTINKEGLNPIILSLNLQNNGGKAPNLITIDEKDTIQFSVSRQVLNKYGFYKANAIVKISDTNGITVEKRSGTEDKWSPVNSSNGVYDLGEIDKDKSANIYFNITFDNPGDYIIELWADDNR